MTIQPRVATRWPPGRPMTICFGSGAATGAGRTAGGAGEAAVGGDGGAGAVKGSGPPAAATRASPFGSVRAANGSAPLRAWGSVFALFRVAPCVGAVLGAADAAT